MTEHFLDPIRTVVKVSITSIDPISGVVESENISITHGIPQQISTPNNIYVANNVSRLIWDQLEGPLRETIARQIIKVLEKPDEETNV